MMVILPPSPLHAFSLLAQLVEIFLMYVISKEKLFFLFGTFPILPLISVGWFHLFLRGEGGHEYDVGDGKET